MPADEGSSVISGTVVDDNGRPVEDFAWGLNPDPNPYQDVPFGPDVANRFSLDVDPGTYTLRATADGYDITELEIDVLPGETTTVKVVLTPSR